MANDGKGFWSSLPGVLTGVAGMIAAITGLYLAFKPVPPVRDRRITPPVPSKPLMGKLQPGWGYPHNDIKADGWISIGSAEACSDLCYERPDCKAMTYVISNKSCWLKFAVPGRTQNSDMISAVKQGSN
jgi:hypothetical protein